MVTLASSTIRCIVRELGPINGQTTETYDFEVDYGGIGDGVENNNAEFITFNRAHINKTNKVRLYIPGGTYMNTYQYISRDHLDSEIVGEEPSGGVWPTRVNPTFFASANGGTNQNNTYPNVSITNERSVRLEAASAGDTVLTVKDRDIAEAGRTLAQLMSMFEVGNYVMVSAYDLMGAGGPANHGLYEHKKITAVGVNTITIATPLVNDYPDDLPEYDPAYSGDWDQGGPASAYAVWPSHESVALLKNIYTETNGVNCGGQTIYVRNCNFREFAPSTCESIYVYDTTVRTQCEFDKLVEYGLIDGCTFDDLLIFQSANNVVDVRNSTISSLGGTARYFTVTDSTVTAMTAMGPTGFGHTEEATFTRVDFTDNLPTVQSGRQYRLDGCIYDDYTIKGFYLECYSYTGTASVGDTITGGTSGATGVVARWQAPWAILESTTGLFQRNETVTSTGFSGTFRCNAFGRPWAQPGCKVVVRPDVSNQNYVYGFTVQRFYQDVTDGWNCVVTDRNTRPSYTIGEGLIASPIAKSVTFVDCTGNDQAVALSQGPAGVNYGAWSRFWLTDAGVCSTPPACYGRVLSFTVNVTRAYTGVDANLYLALGTNGPTGLQLPAGTNGINPDPRVDLKTTGTRIWTPDGNTGVLASDREGTNQFIISSTFTPRLLTTKTGGTVADITDEDPSVWPEFTATIVTEI